MGVFEISSSNDNFKEIKNPINLNKNINNNKDQNTNLNINLIKNDIQKINNFKNKNNQSNENVIKNDIKKNFEIKSRIFNQVNYIHNSKTNYSNYKRVPHLKSQPINLLPTDNKVSNNNNNALLKSKINSEESNKQWFKTQSAIFNKISNVQDVKEFEINESYRRKYKNTDNNINIINKINLYNRNKLQIYKNKNKSKIVYTKVLPIDYNNEKKLENLLFMETKYFNNENLLYIIEKKDFIKIDDNNYSTKKDYKNIIKKNYNNKLLLSNQLLELKERNWYRELVDISTLLTKKRSQNEILIKDKYLRKIIKLNEQFKWIIECLGIYFNNIIFGKENDTNLIDDFNLPTKEKIKWFNGFKWKGIYIKVLTNEKSKILINEVKSLNYFYFEYLQLLEYYPYIQINQLLYHIIFPIIAYTNVNGFILFGSAIININDFCEEPNNLSSINEFISLNDIIKNNNGVINLEFDRINVKLNKDLNYKNKLLLDLENKYYIKDLLNSRLFSELNLYHFIRIYKETFLIFNLYEFIPKLFEMKLGNEYKLNYLSVINNKRIYYNSKLKNNINNINNKKSNEAKSNNLKNKIFSNPKEILTNFFNINQSSHLKSKDIVINNIYFRIIYEAQGIRDDNNKDKQFVDYLFNYNKMITESYIVEPYIILYDLIDPIKLKYSLIKSFFSNIEHNKNHKNNSLNIILNKLFYISTNYISFFNSWCEMLNKNSFNIKTYSDLKENMNKYGISSQLKFFSLININNSEISDIIKISLLVKAIKFIFNKNDNNNILYKLKNSKISNNNDPNKFYEHRKTKLLYIIKSILYPNEIINQSREYFNNLFKELVFYVNIIFLKLKLIDGYLSLGLLNIQKNNMNMNINIISKKVTGFCSAKDFLKHIINIARNKPFLFLTEMEYKLKFIIDPFIKFKSSISIESMSNKLELKHIILNANQKTHSYIKSNQISGLILAKLIYFWNKSNININYNINVTLKNNNSKINSLDPLNNNIALKPNFMRTNINLNNFKSSIKNKTNILDSPIMVSDLDSNKTSKDNFRHLKNGKTSEFYLYTSDKNEFQNSDNAQRLKLLEKEICDNFILEMPSICYKMNYSFEKYKNKKDTFIKFLKNIYPLPEIKIIKKWKDCIYKIFSGILSSNGEIEHSLFKSLVYLYIITFFYEKNFNDANQINSEIKEIFKKGNYQLSLVDLSIINLFQALSSEKYIESEAPYSKCLMLLLMNYGEPRGRNNDSHAILEFPIWKIGRKTRLEQKSINDYFKEMRQCLSFYESKKCVLNIYNTKTIFNYSNNVYNNIENFKNINEILKNFNINNFNCGNSNDDFQNISNESTITEFLNNNISENPGIDFFGNLQKITNNFDISLNKNVFDDKFLNKMVIKYFNFPPVSSNTEKLDKIFFKSDFIIFF